MSGRWPRRAVGVGLLLTSWWAAEARDTPPPARQVKDVSAEDYVGPTLPRARVLLEDAFGGMHAVEVEVAATPDSRSRFRSCCLVVGGARTGAGRRGSHAAIDTAAAVLGRRDGVGRGERGGAGCAAELGGDQEDAACEVWGLIVGLECLSLGGGLCWAAWIRRVWNCMCFM